MIFPFFSIARIFCPVSTVCKSEPSVSVSPGKLSAFGANNALRQSLMAIDVPTMPQPEAYVGNAAKLFDDKGMLVDESTREFMQKFLAAFAKWIERFASR